MDFLALVKEKMALMEMDQSLLNRAVNTGFSGGEKKRNEIFQMAVLEPKLAILDETDSGLDIDALKIVADGVNALRSPDRAMIVVTHYQRLLNYIVPDFVHVLAEGRIVKSGGKELALELEESGYVGIEEASKGMTAAPASFLERIRRRGPTALLAKLGFPTTHDEDWRFTSVAPIARTTFAPSAAMGDRAAGRSRRSRNL